MLVLNAQDVRQSLPMPLAIEAMREAFAALSDGRAAVPHRVHLSLPMHKGISLFMPAFVDDESAAKQSLAMKVVSLFDGNQQRGLARIQAAVLVLAPDTGRPDALLEGATLTAIRTAAASGLATEILARPESRTLAVFGAGAQARAHFEAMCAVRKIECVWVYSRTREKAKALVEEIGRKYDYEFQIGVAATPRDAIAHADIICTTTTSREPVFADADLPPGVHINAVGSYTHDAAEVPPETVARAVVVVDSRAAAWEEAGDLIQPLRAGLISREHVRAELGELVLGRAIGRSDAHQVTLFKSVGIAVQDAVAARFALEQAQRLNLGTKVSF